MPNGRFRPLAKTAICSALPEVVMSPILDSDTKKSPFGAVRIIRGPSRPAMYSSTLKPAGTWGHAPSGRATTFGPLGAEGVAKGAGRSFSVILRLYPGFS